jgi:hypothetical protein
VTRLLCRWTLSNFGRRNHLDVLLKRATLKAGELTMIRAAS